MKIVTVGGGFLDIDGLGSGVAYAELLNLLGEPARFVSTGGMNQSVTSTLRSWALPVEISYETNKDDKFVVVDNSNPEWLEGFITEDNIDEIIDHHLGHEQYWRERGIAADIEFIGAASTMIYERWQKAGKFEEMSQLSARLLACGILDNTLNFRASVSTERDKGVYDELMEKADLGHDWPRQYFEECQQGIEKNLKDAVEKDTKRNVKYPGCDAEVAISQIVVWNGRHLLDKKEELLSITEKYGVERSINIISIEEGKNYFITTSTGLREFYGQVLGLKYKDDFATSERMWLRKEMMQKAISYGKV